MKAGTATVQTHNPFSGAGNNGLSNPINFIIAPPPNPLPALASISPNTAVAGTNGVALTLTASTTPAGDAFIPSSTATACDGSQVYWSAGGVLTTICPSSVTATSIQANVPAALMASGGVANVSVFNPPALPPSGCIENCTGGGGGGTSLSQCFTITPTTQTCASSAASQSSAKQAVEEEAPAVSIDGRYVAYTALQNEVAQIFVRDTCQGAAPGCQTKTTLVSVAADGTVGNEESHTPSISSDGRYVAFSSAGTNLASATTSTTGRQIYLRDTCFGAASTCAPSTQLISTDPNGTLAGTESILPSLSSSGRFVAFVAVTPTHVASQGVPLSKTAAATANSGYRQIFIRDTCLGATSCVPKTTRISLQPGDGSDAKQAGPALSGNAKLLGLSGAGTSTLFTSSIAIDDRVFLAATKEQQ
jgi:hypothetical protein